MNSHAAGSRSLEAEFHRIARRQSQQHQPRLKQWAQALVDFLIGTQPLSIRQKIRKDGTSQWVVYDSASDTRRIFHTAQDVRTWLEKRHR